MFIPARGGSKDIPGKNLIGVGGRPLIMWTVTHCRIFNERMGTHMPIVVSTDSKDISRVLHDTAGVTIDPRPGDLCGDEITTEAVLMEWWVRNPHIGQVILLQATSPIRSLDLMEDVYNTLQEHDSAVVLAEGNPHIFNGDLSERFSERHLRQLRPQKNKIFYDTGNMYGIRRIPFMAGGDRLCGNLGALMVRHPYEALEIDNEWDVPLASIAISVLNNAFKTEGGKKHAQSNLS